MRSPANGTGLTGCGACSRGGAPQLIPVDGDSYGACGDACEAMGITKYRDAMSQLEDDERLSHFVDTFGPPCAARGEVFRLGSAVFDTRLHGRPQLLGR